MDVNFDGRNGLLVGSFWCLVGGGFGLMKEKLGHKVSSESDQSTGESKAFFELSMCGSC